MGLDGHEYKDCWSTVVKSEVVVCCIEDFRVYGRHHQYFCVPEPHLFCEFEHMDLLNFVTHIKSSYSEIFSATIFYIK